MSTPDDPRGGTGARAPRVLVSGVVLGQPPGGVRRHNAELLPRLAALLERAGGSLAVLEGRERVAFDLPSSVERIPSDVPARPVLARAAREGRALRAALRGAARGGRPFDVVHTAHLPSPRVDGVARTLTVHDLRSLSAEHAPPARRLFARRAIASALRGAARVLVVSESVRSELVARFRLDPARVTVVPNAADHLAPLPRAPAADAPLLCVGHLEPRKNLELVLRALALRPGLPRLALAGAEKGGERQRLATLARDLGIERRVEFLGPFEDGALAGLYARAACVVVPSRLEGFGIVALEAQRAGVPLAIAEIGALREVAGATTPGFDPTDAAGCARAIERALAAGRAELDAARARARRYAWDDSARRWFEAACEAAGAARG